MRPISPRTDTDLPPRTAPGGPSLGWGLHYRLLLVGADLVALALAAWLGLLVAPDGSGGIIIAAVLVPAWLLCLAAMGTHYPARVGSGTAELRRVVAASARLALAVLVVAYLGRVGSARDLVLVTLPAGTLLLLAGRVSGRAALVLTRRHGAGGHRVLAVGTVRDVLHLVDQTQRSPGAGFRVVGACVPSYGRADRRSTEDRRRSATLAAHGQLSGDRRADSDRRANADDLRAVGVPVLGTPDEVIDVVANQRADSVVMAGHGLLSRHALRRLAWQLQAIDTRLFVASALSEIAETRITVRTLAGLPLLQVEAPIFGGGRRLLKSALDKVLAGLFAVLLAPLLLGVAVFVASTSPGGVLYRQERIGVGHRSFRCLKFRTMRAGADAEVGELGAHNESDSVTFKIREDPRVTPVGRILRRYSLDELPQLFNVLGGSMSLVGPRPPLPHEVAEYGHDVRRRLLVKPGITGLWQVSGRSDLTWAESVRLDLYYVENWTPSLDLSILARTVVAVAGGRGAY